MLKSASSLSSSFAKSRFSILRTTAIFCNATPSVVINGEQVRYASKASVGSTKNKKDSHSKRLGVKLYGGQKVRAGQIIVRQVGNTYWPGFNVGQGKDFTLYAVRDGWVQFSYDKDYDRNYVYVAPKLATVSQQKPTVESEKSPVSEEDAFKYNKQENKQMVTDFGLPVKRIPHTQVHKVPKIKEYQVKYVVDRYNLKCKSYYRTHRLPPVSEPARINLAQ